MKSKIPLRMSENFATINKKKTNEIHQILFCKKKNIFKTTHKIRSKQTTECSYIAVPEKFSAGKKRDT